MAQDQMSALPLSYERTANVFLGIPNQNADRELHLISVSLNRRVLPRMFHYEVAYAWQRLVAQIQKLHFPEDNRSEKR